MAGFVICTLQICTSVHTSTIKIRVQTVRILLLNLLQLSNVLVQQIIRGISTILGSIYEHTHLRQKIAANSAQIIVLVHLHDRCRLLYGRCRKDYLSRRVV